MSTLDASHEAELERQLEAQIAQWRQFLRRRRAVDSRDGEELEDHLRGQVAALTDAGLSSDEAFLVAVKRMGSLDDLSREFAREHSERLWKQLVIGDVDGGPAARLAARTEAFVAVGLALLAALLVQLLPLSGYPMDEPGPFIWRNAILIVLAHVVAFFAWKRGGALTPARLARLVLPFVAAALVANLHRGDATSQTAILATVHLPIALWLAVGVAYAGGHWREVSARMHFVRYSGELAIYVVLIALGGIVFVGFTMMLFRAIGMNAEMLVGRVIVPSGLAGVLLVASYLVEAKQSVVENMAPVLTRIFTPFFTLLLLGFLATMAWTQRPIDIQRDVLIAFDLLLVLVVGLVLYAASARDPEAPPTFFDTLQLVLVVAALLVDLLALAAVGARISEYGLTPNRVAALGENVVLLVNLAWTAVTYARFIRGRGPFAALERWQTTYLPVHAAWAAIVVAVLPPLFGFR